MASRPDFDEDDDDTRLPPDDADGGVDDLADGEEDAVDRSLTNLPPD